MGSKAGWLALAALIVVADQLTKYAVVQYFGREQGRGGDAVLQPGAGLQPRRRVQLPVGRGRLAARLVHRDRARRLGVDRVTCCASTRTSACSRWRSSLVLAGAVGNVIDRILVGAVVDFLDFHAFG